MTVPFVNYPLQYENLKEEIDQAVKRILESGDLILRKDVEDFEKSLANFLRVKHVIGVNSCTDGLIFSLMAAGIKPDDEVITVSHTFFATIEAVHHVGARPILVDIKDDFLIDADKIKEKITPKTKAIIPVHLNGRVCQMDKILEIAEKYNLKIIEDSAQALGAEFIGKRAGSFGTAGCFSFYPAKILGCLGDGGAVSTNNDEIAEKLRLLRNHGQKAKTEILCYGFTSRLHNLQAAILNVKIRHLADFIKRRREIAQKYNNDLKGVSGLKIPAFDGESRFDVFQNYVIRAEKRDELFKFLKGEGIETLIKDPLPNHWHKNLGLSDFKLPLTEQFSKEVISLPIYPELADEQAQCVVSAVKNFYAN